MIIWLLLALLLLCSGTVSACETALFCLSRQELHRFRGSGGVLRRRVYRLMQQPRRVLMTVLITNTAVNVSIFAVSFVALERLHGHAVLAAAGGIGVLLAVIVFGEMVPKGLALSNPGRFAPPAAVMISAIYTVVAPIQWLLAALLVDPITRLLAPSAPGGQSSSLPYAVTTDELRLLVEQSAREGAIDSKENEMLQAIVALDRASVREVMTPRVDLHWIRIDDDPAAVSRTMRESGRRKLPVCGRNLDDLRGVLYARDLLLNPKSPIRTLVRPIHFVPEQANLVQVIRHFREEAVRFAVAVDEYGGTAGLVSIRDVAGRIVGDLPTGQDAPGLPTALAERIDENTYRLWGDLSVRIWADHFGVGEIDRHIHTLAGLILARLGRLPQAGDSVRIRNLTLTVESLNNRRIERVLLRREGNDDIKAPTERERTRAVASPPSGGRTPAAESDASKQEPPR